VVDDRQADHDTMHKDFVKINEYRSRVEGLQKKLEEEGRHLATNKRELVAAMADMADKIERKIEHTESRCKNEARKLVEFKVKSMSGRANNNPKASAQGRSGSRATLSRAGPSDP
jgi:peptidoglycan hydrolase CwlO-like protein